MESRKILFGALFAALLAGCATKDEPVLGDMAINAFTAETLTEAHEYESRGFSLKYRLHRPVRKKWFTDYPLVVFLHGSGERGDDNVAQLRHGVEKICKYALRHGDAYVLVPQCPAGESWVDWDWSKQEMERPVMPNRTMSAVLGLVENICKRYSVDRDRVYITGISMGGFGTWDAVTRKAGYFAAAVPVCGGADVNTANFYRDVALWFFHGAKDGAVSVEYSRLMHDALEKAKIPHRYTEYPEAGHACWDRVYADEEMLGWLFAARRAK